LSALASAHRAAFNAVQEQTAMALPALPIETLDDIAERIRQRANGMRCDAIGLDLIEAKAILPHGKWLRWLKNEFDRSERTAQRYILVAELAKTDKLSDLSDEPLSALVSAPAAVPTRSSIKCQPASRSPSPSCARPKTRSQPPSR
jgi:Protein of unknown function (DUF3102)